MSLSSSGILSGSRKPSAPLNASGTRGLFAPSKLTHSFSTVRVFKPKKSIFRSPTGSTKCPSYCVVKSFSPDSAAESSFFPLRSGVGITGSVSISGSREIIMPHAWTPGWRMEPSKCAARSIRRWIIGSLDSNAAFRSGASLRAFAKLIFGVSGTSEASLLVSARG